MRSISAHFACIAHLGIWKVSLSLCKWVGSLWWRRKRQRNAAADVKRPQLHFDTFDSTKRNQNMSTIIRGGLWGLFCADSFCGNSRGGALEFLPDSDALCDVHLKAVLLPSSIPFTTWSFFCFSRSLNNKRWLHITQPTDFNPAVPYSLVITVVLIYFFNWEMNKLQSSHIGVALFNYVPIGYGNLLNELLHAEHHCL